ncbi:hypothetical protein [Natronobeatus ordinarius]|uniref:hypothetical protein n=1 Tax=Natronobeatus ordinarius TaxID=2963433 RepID=UPI0020CBE305|nr:hypothetical protein [Natronobeatus ordinarius]
MTNGADLDGTSRTECLVLLGLVELECHDRTPAQTHELRSTCRDGTVGEAVVGSVSEADVMRSLYRLEASDVVEEVTPETTSPTGKGRPSYELAVDPEEVVDHVATEPPFDEVADELRESTL